MRPIYVSIQINMLTCFLSMLTCNLCILLCKINMLQSKLHVDISKVHVNILTSRVNIKSYMPTYLSCMPTFFPHISINNLHVEINKQYRSTILGVICGRSYVECFKIAILHDLYTKGNSMSPQKILLKRVSCKIVKVYRRKFLTEKGMFFFNDVYLNIYFHIYFLSVFFLIKKYKISNIINII